MNIAAVSTPLCSAARNAVKSPQIRFGEEPIVKPDKAKWQFSLKDFLSGVFYVAFAISSTMCVFKITKAQRMFDNRETYRNSVVFRVLTLVTLKEEHQDKFEPCLTSLCKTANEGTLPEPWQSASTRATQSYRDVFTSLAQDEALLLKSSAPLDAKAMETLYERYAQRPESIKAFGLRPTLKQGFLQIDAKLEQAYEQYLQTGEGKQNPVSKDEFALLADTYRFFRQAHHQYDNVIPVQKLYKEYLDTVIAKHAQNPNLPGLKAYADKALVSYEKDFEKLNHERPRTMLKHCGYLGYHLLLLLGFMKLVEFLEKSKQAKAPTENREA